MTILFWIAGIVFALVELAAVIFQPPVVWGGMLALAFLIVMSLIFFNQVGKWT